jgi:hypothetical protein
MQTLQIFTSLFRRLAEDGNVLHCHDAFGQASALPN